MDFCFLIGMAKNFGSSLLKILLLAVIALAVGVAYSFLFWTKDYAVQNRFLFTPAALWYVIALFLPYLLNRRVALANFSFLEDVVPRFLLAFVLSLIAACVFKVRHAWSGEGAPFGLMPIVGAVVFALLWSLFLVQQASERSARSSHVLRGVQEGHFTPGLFLRTRKWQTMGSGVAVLSIVSLTALWHCMPSDGETSKHFFFNPGMDAAVYDWEYEGAKAEIRFIPDQQLNGKFTETIRSPTVTTTRSGTYLYVPQDEAVQLSYGDGHREIFDVSDDMISGASQSNKDLQLRLTSGQNVFRINL